MIDDIWTGTLTIDLLGFWHAGGGVSGSYGADAVVRKERGLPVLPGRHLLGLLAHKLHFLVEHAHLNAHVRDVLCGQGVEDSKVDPTDRKAKRAAARGGASKKAEKTRFESIAGALLVDTARLDDAWRSHFAGLREDEALRKAAALYRRYGMTALKDGVAADHTLRQIEVTVPMTLTAQVQIDRSRFVPDPHDAEPMPAMPTVDALVAGLTRAAGLVQHVGRHRTRGLGRARLTLTKGAPS